MAPSPPPLRLAWSNPQPAERVGATAGERRLGLVPPPHPAGSGARPLNLAWAIERHLAGEDGLTEEEFLALYARGCRPGAAS